MPHFIRRKSDSLTFTFLWWAAFFISGTDALHHQQGSSSSPLDGNLDIQQQQMKACQQDFIELKDQMRRHAKVLKHLQTHEERFKDTETLLNEYYLDMDVVETVGDGPSLAELSEDVSSLSRDARDMTQDIKLPSGSPPVLGKIFSVIGNLQSTAFFKVAPKSYDPLHSSTGMGSCGLNSRLGWKSGLRRMDDNDKDGVSVGSTWR
ncbi:hypothetical protein EMPS_08449 [Entomortierella parvispora]|uniref:Uncharacterized protein n=1 Tax=Entomortierella parvispora TaxID=205924 RepID=A0A9P3LZL8_9FUNG|nr:hypothetical protein EMPS_08449 [Entomortierella parvispora]